MTPSTLSFSRASTARMPRAIRWPSIEPLRDCDQTWRDTGVSLTPPCPCRTGRPPSSKAVPSGGASAVLRACSWSTTGCASGCANAATRPFCRPGTARCSRSSHSAGCGSAFDPRSRHCANEGGGTSCLPRTPTVAVYSARRMRSPGRCGKKGILATTCCSQEMLRLFGRGSASRQTSPCCSTLPPGGTIGPTTWTISMWLASPSYSATNT